MAFWNREELPPELRDKKPEEITAALNRLKELEGKETQFNTDKTELETRLASQNTEYERMKARLTELEAGPQEPKPPVVPDEPVSPWVDPAKYIDEQTKTTQVAALASARMAARLTFKEGLSGRDRAIFTKYENEVTKTIETYQPLQQGMPQNWLIAFTYVKGLHEQEIAKMGENTTEFFSEPGSRGPAPEPTPQDKLSPDEEEICRKMHWDPVGYLKRKKEGQAYTTQSGGQAIGAIKFQVPERTSR